MLFPGRPCCALQAAQHCISHFLQASKRCFSHTAVKVAPYIAAAVGVAAHIACSRNATPTQRGTAMCVQGGELTGMHVQGWQLASSGHANRTTRRKVNAKARMHGSQQKAC